MTKLGKLWTGAVAYVSLLVGAGLSVAGNLADTYRTRGADVDTLDKVMAAAWPILVLLAIEMFVNPRWPQNRMYQVWRWLGCLAVGLMAMIVSWTHLHDLMASRGQLFVVTILGPLAIDGMAIMATGLILSTRVRGQALTDTRTSRMSALVSADTEFLSTAFEDDGHGHEPADCADTWTGPVATAADVAESEAAFRGEFGQTPVSEDGYARGRWADLVSDVPGDYRPDTDTVDDWSKFASWAEGADRAVSELGRELVTEVERFANGQADTLPQRTRTVGVSMPAEFLELAAAWAVADALPRADMVKLSASYFGVSTRTASRWLAATRKES